jgi:uncharacterized membrane protein YvbJ
MSCEHLACARCGGPVSEGRCPACRASRQELHHSHVNYTPHILIASALLIVLVVLLTVHGVMG